MEDIIKKLDIKFKLLKLMADDVPRIIERNNLRELEKTVTLFEQRTDEIQNHKLTVQELKLEAEVDPAEVFTWGEELETKVDNFRGTVDQLNKEIARVKEENVKGEVIKEELVSAKLPKLSITVFNGTLLDWRRFWSQFSTQIDGRNSISSVTKLSYLRELISPKSRVIIDGLPFTTEGYARAKAILCEKYGRDSEVANAHIQAILSLPSIVTHNRGNPGFVEISKIHEFYEKLLTNVQTLDTMGKLDEIKGYVRMTLDKLPDIRSDLVRLDDDWQEWNFRQLLESLRKWVNRNPLPREPRNTERKNVSQNNSCFNNKYGGKPISDHLLQTTMGKCVYCESTAHKSFDCSTITSVGERKALLARNKLCFNCTRPYHQARDCRSNSKCKQCQRKHHSSICNTLLPANEYPNINQGKTNTMMVNEKSQVVYPVVVVYVDGIMCRALLDTGAGSSYASAYLLDMLDKKPKRTEIKTVEMMMSSKNAKIDIYDVEIENLDKTFKLRTELNEVQRNVLINIDNPRYDQMKRDYPHLANVKMSDTDTKAELPIHVILGASEYARIKTQARPKLGKQGDPVAEQTKFGWTIMKPGTECDVAGTLFTKSTPADYDRLCSLDVLGITETDDQREVFQEFKSQLTRKADGHYETGLLWKVGHPSLPNNKAGSVGRLKNLVKRLESDPDTMETYDNVIKQQLKDGIIEKATTDENTINEYYIPHKPVIRRNAESTKLRVVYDASASNNGVSLNSCLEPGPPLQNLLWSVIVRNRTHPIALCADMKQAFLQIRIKEEDRDSLRFHWIKDRDPTKIETYRFTRALFGLNQSPFLLQGTIHQHLDNEKEIYDQELIEKIRREVYVDDVISGGETVEKARELKETLIKLFGDAGFTLHKWHSNVSQLVQSDPDPDEETNLSQEQLIVAPQGVTTDHPETNALKDLNSDENTTSLLGLLWDKENDTLSVRFPESNDIYTKRSILHTLASIYDPLGISGPITLLGKLIYRDTCDRKLGWDEEIPHDLLIRWKRWVTSLPTEIKIPRAFGLHEIRITSVDVHTFADASTNGVCATTFLVMTQADNKTSQGILAAKCRLAKKGLTIPRLELIAAHMAANLCGNTVESLQPLPIRETICWTDSTVVLHWLQNSGSYKAFVTNRVAKILNKEFISWRHVPTNENPADDGSRGRENSQLKRNWFNGPDWLATKGRWPDNIVSKPSAESENEVKKVKTVLATAVRVNDNKFQTLMEKLNLWKFLRVTSWVARFVNNCRKARVTGPLSADEVHDQLQYWVKSMQQQHQNDEAFETDVGKLNLQKDGQGIYKCFGRIYGEYPVYLPRDAILCEKIVMEAHLRTLHGGVSQTMSAIREKYWVTRLRSLVKKIIKECNGCKRFHAIAFPTPPPGKLPQERSTATTKPFKVIGVDYAGPFLIRQEQKVYILLFACIVSRAIHLELLDNQTTDGFIKALKRLIARRGLPTLIYSDNARTFQAGAKWLRRILMSNELHGFSATQEFRWRFNLSRAPWWGGQYERLVGLVKQSFYKAVGKTTLTFNEFEEVLLDIETTLNNRPLCYMEDNDLQQRTLTPNTMIHGESIPMPEEDDEVLDDNEMRKRLRYLKKCKDEAWKRWQGEYMRALRERHNLQHSKNSTTPQLGDVVMVKGDSKNRGKWTIGIVVKRMIGRDDILRAVRVKTANQRYLERAVQHLYPLELSCNMREKDREQPHELNPRISEFRPRRTAAVVSKMLTQDTLECEECEPDVEL